MINASVAVVSGEAGELIATADEYRAASAASDGGNGGVSD
jgi:hypothetical protein